MEARLKGSTGSRIVAWGETAIRVEPLAELIEKGLRQPELLHSDQFRRRFDRAVRRMLAEPGTSKGAVMDQVDSALSRAPHDLCEAVKAMLAASLTPSSPRADGLLPLVSRLAGAEEAREVAAILMNHLRARYGEDVAAQLWLLAPKPELCASLEGSAAGEPLMIHWTDGDRELARLALKGLNAVQTDEIEELAPWLQPVFKRLVHSAAEREAAKTARREGHLWQLRAELSQIAQTPQSEDAYLRQVVGRVHKRFDAVQVVYWGYDPADDSMAPKHHSRPNRPELDVPISLGFFQEAIANRQVKTAARKGADGQLRLFLLGPIFNGETLEGVMQVILPTRFIGCEAEEELEVVDDLVAQGLKTVRFYEQLSFHASHDPLTGLANRRTFEQFIDREFKLAERHSTPTSLIVVDVDHFKQYNDAFGHPAGDALLQGIAGAIAEATRSTDFVARYGGEEFVIVLPHTDSTGAHAAANKVLEAIRHLNQHTTVLSGQVTASVGVASYPDDARNVSALLQAADQAMYQAKHAGRNRICQAGA
ncbi:MAG TPA: GGDEF domain-containing protein [Oscillatoriaceae cyanobacterium]